MRNTSRSALCWRRFHAGAAWQPSESLGRSAGSCWLEQFHPDRKSRCKCVIPAEALQVRHPRVSGDPSRLGPRLRGDDEKDAFQSGCKPSRSGQDKDNTIDAGRFRLRVRMGRAAPTLGRARRGPPLAHGFRKSRTPAEPVTAPRANVISQYPVASPTNSDPSPQSTTQRKNGRSVSTYEKATAADTGAAEGLPNHNSPVTTGPEPSKRASTTPTVASARDFSPARDRRIATTVSPARSTKTAGLACGSARPGSSNLATSVTAPPRTLTWYSTPLLPAVDKATTRISPSAARASVVVPLPPCMSPITVSRTGPGTRTSSSQSSGPSASSVVTTGAVKRVSTS